MNTLGNKIKELRKKKGMSQESLAEAANVNLRTIQRIEKGESEPRGKTLNLICEVLEVNVEDILNYGKKSDEDFLAVFHLSVLSFLIFPLGNILLPLILWLTRKDKIIGLNEIGSTTLNFQITWTVVTFTSIIAYASFKIMHYPLGIYFFYLFILLYVVNIVVPVVLALRVKKGGDSAKYPKLLTIIR